MIMRFGFWTKGEEVDLTITTVPIFYTLVDINQGLTRNSFSFRAVLSQLLRLVSRCTLRVCLTSRQLPESRYPRQKFLTAPSYMAIC